jgi:hypothetical protein
MHDRIRSVIQRKYKQINGITCPWDGSEAKALDKMLKSNPSWTVSDWLNMLRNYFGSDVNGERPRVWIPQISKWSAGSTDKYGHLLPREKMAYCEVCMKNTGEDDGQGPYVCSPECEAKYMEVSA